MRLHISFALLIIYLIDVDGIYSRDARANLVPFSDPRLLGHHDADHADEVLSLLQDLLAVRALTSLSPLAIIHDDLAADAGRAVADTFRHVRLEVRVIQLHVLSTVICHYLSLIN